MRSGFPHQKVAHIITRFCGHSLTSNSAHEYDAVPNNDWAETYNAAKGCIAVYVVRGYLTRRTDYERKQLPTDPPEALR